MTAEFLTCRYRVDEADLLVSVDDIWLAFAAENGAAELDEASVLGRPLWEFVAGDETRRLYSEMHTRVRQKKTPVVLPFRCDSPSLRRHMQLTISAWDADQLTYESVLLRVEPQRPLGIFDSMRPRSNSILTVCSCCKRALLEPAGWLDVEEVSTKLRLFETQKVPDLRYAVCPNCTKLIGETSSNGNIA
jgi:hypothetical protein